MIMAVLTTLLVQIEQLACNVCLFMCSLILSMIAPGMLFYSGSNSVARVIGWWLVGKVSIKRGMLERDVEFSSLKWSYLP